MYRTLPRPAALLPAQPASTAGTTIGLAAIPSSADPRFRQPGPIDALALDTDGPGHPRWQPPLKEK
jgi:hypothetical protein